MRKLWTIASVAFASLSIVLTTGCCCPCPPPPACPVVPNCSHPEVPNIEQCIETCAQAPEDARPTCLDGCCARINQIEGTDSDREAVRACIRNCNEPN